MLILGIVSRRLFACLRDPGEAKRTPVLIVRDLTDIQLFRENTRQVMQSLVRILPRILDGLGRNSSIDGA
jgi:hypothetical protein